MARKQTLKTASCIVPSISMESAVQSFFSYGQSRNLSSNTLVYYRYRLQAFKRYLDDHSPDTSPTDVTPQFVRSFITYESQHTSPATANHSVIALKAFFNFLVKDGILEDSPMDGVQKVKHRKTVIDTFKQEQIEAILKTCEKDFTGARDQAIITVLIVCGSL